MGAMLSSGGVLLENELFTSIDLKLAILRSCPFWDGENVTRKQGLVK